MWTHCTVVRLALASQVKFKKHTHNAHNVSLMCLFPQNALRKNGATKKERTQRGKSSSTWNFSKRKLRGRAHPKGVHLSIPFHSPIGTARSYCLTCAMCTHSGASSASQENFVSSWKFKRDRSGRQPIAAISAIGAFEIQVKSAYHEFIV